MKRVKSKPLFLLLYLAGCSACIYSCKDKGDSPAATGWSKPLSDTSSASYDLSEIQSGGELIVGTMYGPQSYFEQGGRKLGLQYLLAEAFALHEGLKIRIEVAKDTTELLENLKNGTVDMIAYALPLPLLQRYHLVPVGYRRTESEGKEKTVGSWAVREQSSDLETEVEDWYSPDLLQRMSESRFDENAGRTFRHRHIYAPYRSRSKGIISSYDGHFKQAGRTIGWDWRLLAAQCYQESGFDPQAVSWAGARGLMQIMPGTARHLGVSESDLFNPRVNIETGARYLRELGSRFSDVHSRYDRICFMLAAYNGGYYHIRDAMSLARKYGRNPYRWSDVAPYVLGLSEARYFRDPVVKYGYMIGRETYNYVHAVVERWHKYQTGSSVAPLTDNFMMPMRATRKNRFSRKQQILHPSDSAFFK